MMRPKRRLLSLDLDRVDLVDAPANPGAFVLLMKSADRVPVVKVDRERRRVYGFANIAMADGQEIVDAHGDVISPDELEEAAALFRGSAGVGHRGEAVGEVFESVYLDATKAAAMGLKGADGMAAWWIGVQLPPGPVWEDVKAGKLPAFSIQGRALVEAVEKSRSREQTVAPAPVPNREREAYLRERLEAIRKNGDRPFVPETAFEAREREVRMAKQKLAKLETQLKELGR